MRASGSNGDNRNRVESFTSQLLNLTQNVNDYKINRLEGGERNMLTPNNVPLETQVINLLSDNEGVAARALALLLDPDIEKKYLGERNGIAARKEFINFLFNNMRQKTAYNGEVDPAQPEKGAIDIDKLFKKVGADLYRAALAEEAASPEFRYACFLRSTQFYDSPELTQKFMMTIGGASGSGKSFASIRIIDLLLKYSPCSDKKGNFVVFVDGGIVRETSIMRELTRTAARVLGYSGVKGLDSGLDDFDVKEFIKLAAYEAGRFNLVVLETFSKPLNRNRTFDEIEEMARKKNILHVFAITEPPAHLAKDYINFILKSSALRAYCTDYGPESAATISFTQNVKKREETESKTPPKGISVEYGDTGSKEILARYEKIHSNVNDKSVRGAVFHIVTDLIIVNEGANIVRLADRDYQKYLMLVQSQKKDDDDKNVSLDKRKYTPLIEWYKNLEIKAPLQLQVSMFNMGDVNITNFFAHLNVADVIINQRKGAAYDIQNDQLTLLQNPADEKIKLGKRSAGRGSMLLPAGRGSFSGSERSSFSSGSPIESQSPISSRAGAPVPPPRTDMLTDLKAVELLLQKAHTARRVSECPESDIDRKERMKMIGNLAYYIAMMGKLDKVYPQHIQEDMSQYLAQKIILLLDAEIILKGEFKQKINLWLGQLKTAVPDDHNRQAALNYMTVQWLNQALLVEDLAGLPKKMDAELKCQYKIDKLISFVNNVYECDLPDESRNIFLSKMVKSFVSLSLTDSKNADRFDASITKLFNYLYQTFSVNEHARQLMLGSVTKECIQHINAANCNMETKLQAFTVLKSKLSGYAVNPDGTNPINVTAILNYMTNQMMILYQDEIKKIISTKLEAATKIETITQLIKSFDKNLVNEKGAMQGSIKDFRQNMDAQLSSLVRQKISVSTTNGKVNTVLAAAQTAKAAPAQKPELVSRPSLQQGGSEPVRPAAPPRKQDILRPTPVAAAGSVNAPTTNKAAVPERVNAAVAPKPDPRFFSNSPKMSQDPKDALNRPPKRPDDPDNKYKK